MPNKMKQSIAVYNECVALSIKKNNFMAPFYGWGSTASISLGVLNFLYTASMQA